MGRFSSSPGGFTGFSGGFGGGGGGERKHSFFHPISAVEAKISELKLKEASRAATNLTFRVISGDIQTQEELAAEVGKGLTE